MKKHITGFLLFSFIVGTAAFIYSIFSIVNVEEVYAPTTYAPVNSCWKMKRTIRKTDNDSPIIKQVDLDFKTKQLNLKLNLQSFDSPIQLRFFIKKGNDVRFLTSEIVPYDATINNTGKFTSYSLQTDELGEYGNLYLIAEPILDSDIKTKDINMEFDPSKAILIMKFSK